MSGRYYLALFTMLAILILPSACGSSTTPEPSPIPTSRLFPKLSGEWTVKMTQSGGIMGMFRSVEVTNDGKIHIDNQRGSKQSVDRTMSQDQLAKVIELVNSSTFKTPQKPDAACADCFIFDLEITSNGQTFSAQLNDISLPNSGLGPLIVFLGNLMDDLLIPV